MYRRHLAEALAVSDLPPRPRWTVRARFALTALRTLPHLALTVPDRTGGVTILINAGFAGSGGDTRATLLHELVHAVQLGDAAHRARAVRGLRIDTGVEQADPDWVRAANLLVDQDEAEATAAESWTWQQVEAERAQEDAMLRAEHAEQQERDQAEAACGRMRTACTWCDGEFYVPEDAPGPHSCPACDYKNGY
jgi:rubrerythrin